VLLSSAVLTAVVTGVAGFVGRLAVGLGSAAVAWLRGWRLARPQTYLVAVGKKRLPFHHDLVKPYVLVVRYGTDDYIRHMASEREKHDGRLQNKAIMINVVTDDDGVSSFKLELPIHRRLGTQFKCFVDVKDEARVPEVTDFLVECPRLHEVSRSSSQFRTRIYFLLRDFAEVKTVEGISNNMCFPL
jgi:hypothetical protein